MDLVKKATPELRGYLATQKYVLERQKDYPLAELPIDPDAEHHLQRVKTDPNAKKPQAVVAVKGKRGGAPRQIPKGSTCAFPTASERQGAESREFEEGELVCLQNEAETSKELAVYLRTEGSQHVVKTGDADQLYVVWWRIGKYTAEQMPGFMSSFYSTIGLSNQPPSAPGVGGKGKSRRHKLKSKKRITRRR